MDKNPFIKYRNLYIIPTFHSRIEFSRLVRLAFFQVFPDVIAVELPDNIRNEIIEGIDRLPYLSLIAYADTLNPQKMNFIPIDPGDSIITGVKIGLEHGIPVEFIDLSISEYVPPGFQLPDDHSVSKIGLKAFYENISLYFNDLSNNQPSLDFLYLRRALIICGVAFCKNPDSFLLSVFKFKSESLRSIIAYPESS